MSGIQIASLVSLTICGILAWGNLQSFGLKRDSMIRMAAAWAAIIIGLVLLIQYFQG